MEPLIPHHPASFNLPSLLWSCDTSHSAALWSIFLQHNIPATGAAQRSGLLQSRDNSHSTMVRFPAVTQYQPQRYGHVSCSHVIPAAGAALQSHLLQSNDTSHSAALQSGLLQSPTLVLPWLGLLCTQLGLLSLCSLHKEHNLSSVNNKSNPCSVNNESNLVQHQ